MPSNNDEVYDLRKQVDELLYTTKGLHEISRRQSQLTTNLFEVAKHTKATMQIMNEIRVSLETREETIVEGVTKIFIRMVDKMLLLKDKLDELEDGTSDKISFDFLRDN